MYGGDVFITSRGPLAGKYIEIGAAPSPERGLRDGDQILGRDPPSLDRVLQRTWDNLTTAAAFAADVRPQLAALTDEIEQLRATLEQIAPDVALRADVDALVAEGQRTYAALGGEPGIDRMTAMIERGRSTITQARETIAKLRTSAQALGTSLAALRIRLNTRGAEAFARIEAAIARVRAAIDKIDPLLAQRSSSTSRAAKARCSS
jgi:hypothetical protein